MGDKHDSFYRRYLLAQDQLSLDVRTRYWWLLRDCLETTICAVVLGGVALVTVTLLRLISGIASPSYRLVAEVFVALGVASSVLAIALGWWKLAFYSAPGWLRKRRAQSAEHAVQAARNEALEIELDPMALRPKGLRTHLQRFEQLEVHLSDCGTDLPIQPSVGCGETISLIDSWSYTREEFYDGDRWSVMVNISNAAHVK